MTHIALEMIDRGSEATPVQPQDKRRSFGALLRAYRGRSGFSQQALAERAALSSAAVGALEQGKRQAPYAYTVGQLADALSLAPAEREDLENAASRGRGRAETVGEPAPAQARNHLPVVLTPFIFRPEIDELVDLIDRYRLVTIAGLGGIGKTRSAVEVAMRSAKHPADTVVYLDLSKIAEGHHIVGALAAPIGAQATAAWDVNAVAASFANQNFLLVLDNCEHLIEPVAMFASELLQACSGLSILATSREPLALSSEVVYRLPPLRNPEKAVSSIEEARSYSAIDLFLTRAYAAGARLKTSPENLALIANICRQLDGIPLAIELATARVSTLGLDTLCARLCDTLTSPGARDRPARQQTMEATIAWSYELLAQSERALLRRLCVFAGGFVLDAAEHVCSDQALPESTIAETLSQLVNKSLVSLKESATTRYTLLESIRAFAWRRLAESGEKDGFIRRHALWLVELADDLNEKTLGSRPGAHLFECENAQSAVERLLDGTTDEALLAARILSGFRFLLMHHPPQTVIAAATTLLTRVDERKHPVIALHLLWLLLYPDVVHEQDVMRALFARAIRLCDGLDDNFLVSTCEIVAKSVCWRGWLPFADQAIALADEIDARGGLTNRHRRASYLACRAWIHCMAGRLGEARVDLRALVDLTHDASSNAERSLGLWAFAEVECAAGNYERASDYCREGLSSDALRFDQQLYMRTKLAGYLLLAGDAGGAEIQAREVLSSPTAEYVAETALALQHLAGAAAVKKHPVLAARLLGFIDEWHRRNNRVRLITEQCGYDLLMESLQAQLSASTIAEYAAAGARLSQQTITEEVLTSPPLTVKAAETDASSSDAWDKTRMSRITQVTAACREVVRTGAHPN